MLIRDATTLELVAAVTLVCLICIAARPVRVGNAARKEATWDSFYYSGGKCDVVHCFIHSQSLPFGDRLSLNS